MLLNSPGGPNQYVPLEQDRANLRAFAAHACLRAHEGIRTILITPPPPPIDERKLAEADQVKCPELDPDLRRTAANTALYAQAARDVGEDLSLPVLDIWSAMMRRAEPASDSFVGNILPVLGNVGENKILQEFLHDGVLFSLSGFKVLYEWLMAVIERTWPDQVPDKLPLVFPAWSDGLAWGDHRLSEARRSI